MKSLARVFLVLCMSGTLASCISFNIRVPPQSQLSTQRPAPAVPEVIPSPAGTPTTPPPITNLNSPTGSIPAAPQTITTTTPQAADSTYTPTSNVIPVGKGVNTTVNPPPLKKKPTPPTDSTVLTQPNMQ